MAVQRDEAELYLGIFDSNIVGEIRKATNRVEAKQLFNQLREANYSGGSTNIANAIREAIAHIKKLEKENPLLDRPEIVVLTDEDSSTESLHEDEVKGFKIHGFAMDQANPGLVALAQQTGGVGMENC